MEEWFCLQRFVISSPMKIATKARRHKGSPRKTIFFSRVFAFIGRPAGTFAAIFFQISILYRSPASECRGEVPNLPNRMNRIFKKQFQIASRGADLESAPTKNRIWDTRFLIISTPSGGREEDRGEGRRGEGNIERFL